MKGKVLSVSRSPVHGFHKEVHDKIRLLEGLGVEGDAHAGKTAQHLFRKKQNPDAPNLAQVHFLHRELFDEVAEKGFTLMPGFLGENVLTEGIDLLNLPAGTIFHIGEAIVEISGIRNPCIQIDKAAEGLTRALIARDAEGQMVRKAGIMGIVVASGDIKPGDMIEITLPEGPHRRLEVV